MYILIVSIYIYIYYDTRFLSYSLCQHRKKEPRRRSNGSKSRVQGTAGIGASPGFLLRGVLNIYIYTYDIYIHDMIWYDMISYIYMPYIYIYDIRGQGMKQESPNCDLRMGHLILWSILGSPWDHVMLDIQKNIQILCAHDFGTRKHGNLVVIVFFHISEYFFS